MARPQSSLVGPRNFFEEDRFDFAVSRRTLEASVGRLGRRVFGTTSARAISSFSRARASARLASWEAVNWPLTGVHTNAFKQRCGNFTVLEPSTGQRA